MKKMKLPCIYVAMSTKYDKKHCVKIGFTNDLDRRIWQLSHEDGNFYEIYCFLPVHHLAKSNCYDKYVHTIIHILAPDLRIQNEREYYNITPSMAASILSQIGGIVGNDVVYPITYRKGKGRKLIAYDIEYLLSIYNKVSFEFSPEQECLIQFVKEKYGNKYLILPDRDNYCINLANQDCIVKHLRLWRNIIVIDIDAGKAIAEFEVSKEYYFDKYTRSTIWHEYTGKQYKYFENLQSDYASSYILKGRV